MQSFRHFDPFHGAIHFPRGRLADRSNRTLRVTGWLGATIGIFRTCWGCYDGFCTSRSICCGSRPDPGCFDGLYFTRDECCGTKQASQANHPEHLVQSLYEQLGIEQEYQRLDGTQTGTSCIACAPIVEPSCAGVGRATGGPDSFLHGSGMQRYDRRAPQEQHRHTSTEACPGKPFS